MSGVGDDLDEQGAAATDLESGGTDSVAEGNRLIDRTLAFVREPAVIVVIASFGAVALARFHDRWAPLRVGDYRSWFIGDALLSGVSVRIVLVQLVFVALLVPRTWSDYVAGRAARWVVGVSVGTLAIGFTVYARNEYLAQFHLLDRIILLGLAVGTLWRVALLPAFVLFCYVIVGQFRWPLLNYSWTDKLVIFEVLLAVQVAFGWQALVRSDRLDARPAITASMVVLGSWYLSAGVDKLRLGWVWKTDLSNLIKSAWVEGWLRFLPAGFVEGLAGLVSFLNPLLLLGTLLIEVGFVFLLFTTSKLRTIALGSFALMHLMIFVLTGIFFWKWVALDVVLAVVLLRERFTLDIRSAVAAGATILVLQSQVSVNLAWVDAPVTHVFSVVAVEPDGEEFIVPERFFAPFELIVTQDRFGYLTEQPLIANAYGTLEHSIDADLLDGLTAETLTDFRNEHGVVRYSETRSLLFDEFVRLQCSTWVNRRWLDGWPLFPPPHIWTTDPTDQGGAPERIERVIVRLDTWFLDDLSDGPVESEIVREIEVEDGCADDSRAGGADHFIRRAVP